MRTSWKLLIGAMLLLFSLHPCLAQNTVNVYLDATVRDDLGKQLATSLREKINQSSLLSLVYSDDVGAISIHPVTLNPDSDGSTQYQTIYSFVLTLKRVGEVFDLYLTSSVGNCGRNKIDSCASGFKADVDEWADVIRKAATKK